MLAFIISIIISTILSFLYTVLNFKVGAKKWIYLIFIPASWSIPILTLAYLALGWIGVLVAVLYYVPTFIKFATNLHEIVIYILGGDDSTDVLIADML